MNLNLKKKRKKQFSLFLAILIACTIPLIIILAQSRQVIFNNELYIKGFEKYSIYSHFEKPPNQLNKSELNNITHNLLEYLKSESKEINKNFFNKREQTHLVEVRDLISKLFKFQNILILLLILIVPLRLSPLLTKKINRLKEISTILIKTGKYGDTLIVILIIFSLFFSFTFLWFHKIAFVTDTWLLDPATSNLINMFPEAFFLSMFTRIIILSALWINIVLISGILLKYLIKHPEYSKYLSYLNKKS